MGGWGVLFLSDLKFGGGLDTSYRIIHNKSGFTEEKHPFFVQNCECEKALKNRSDFYFSPVQQVEDSQQEKNLNNIKMRHIKMHFVDAADINRRAKKANVEAMAYYVSQKEHEIKKSLLHKKYNEYLLTAYPDDYQGLNREKNFVFDWNIPKVFPIEVIESYQKDLLHYKNYCLLDYVDKTFLGYIKTIEKTNRYLYLENKKTNEIFLKKILTRYDENYRKKIIKRMNWLMWKYGNENCCLMTLTISPEKYGYDKFAMWQSITKKFDVFIRKLKIYYKRKKKKFPPYIYGIEAMCGRPENNYVSRGNPHLHVCFFNCKYLAPKSVLETYWGQGFIKINSTFDNQKVRYPIHYITKYITETFTVNSPDNITVQGLVWFFNKHSFDHSAGLVLPLYPKCCGDWSLCGIVSVNSGLGLLQLDEMILIREFMLSLCGGFKNPPPEWGDAV
jgi:hypothetical protein